MARTLGAQCKMCRRIGEKLFLKGNRCSSDKCAVERRPFPPGPKAAKGRRSKLSNYGLQLREKQKIKKIYGVLEKPFRRYFELSERKKGVTGTNLLRYLELRLDNVVYRLGFALSRKHARQLVKHALFTVNGKNVNIPSYILRVNDEIRVRSKENWIKHLNDNMELTQNREKTDWLELGSDKLSGKLTRLPEREDMNQTVEEQKVVELYSK